MERSGKLLIEKSKVKGKITVKTCGLEDLHDTLLLHVNRNNRDYSCGSIYEYEFMGLMAYLHDNNIEYDLNSNLLDLYISEKKKNQEEKEKLALALTSFEQQGNFAYKEYQREDIETMSSTSAFLLGNSMGLGKTVTMLSLLKPTSKCLVFVNSIGKGVWLSQQQWFRSDLKASAPKEFSIPPAGELYVYTYNALPEMASRAKKGLPMEEYLRQLSSDVVVFADEAHQVKSIKANRTKLFRKLSLEILRVGGKVIEATGPQPVDEPVLTPEGWREIGSLSIGDKVFSVDGTTTLVVGVYPQGEKEIYKVTFSDNSFTFCCGDHLWEVGTNSNRSFSRGNDVYPTWYLKNMGTHSSGNAKYFIPYLSPISYNFSEKLPIHPYALGILLGDGCLSKGTVTFAYHPKDEETHFRLQNMLSEWKVTPVKNRAKRTCWESSITRRNNKERFFHHIIEDLGLDVGFKEKFIPEIYLRASVEDRLFILGGLLDSDGCVIDNCIRYSTSSFKLFSSIQDLVNGLGGLVTYSEDTRNINTNYSCSIQLPKQFNPFLLERKKNNYFPELRRAEPIRYISDISLQKYTKDCVCIRVEDERGLYVTRSHIVTHNTPLLKSPDDLWCLLENINMAKKCFKSKEEFNTLMGGKTIKSWHGFQLVWNSNDVQEDVVKERLKKAMIARKREDVLKELPDKIRNYITIPIPAKERRELDSIKLEDGNDPRVMNLRERLANQKIPAVKELVNEILAEEAGPVIIFTCFKSSAYALGKAYGCPAITGDMKPEDRQRVAEEFQAGKHPVLVATILAGGFAITLTRGNKVVFLDRSWTPPENWQAEDRVMRIGQTETCNIWYFLSEHKIEDRLTELCTMKEEFIRKSI